MSSKLLTAVFLVFTLSPAALAQTAPGTATAPPAPPPATAPAVDTAPVLDRSLLEAELRELERRRAEISLGGPIAMMIGGGVGFVTGGVVLLAAAMLDAMCDPDFGDGSCSGADDSVYVIGGVAMLAGAVIGIAGLVMLIDRAEERRPLGVRIKEIRRQLGP